MAIKILFATDTHFRSSRPISRLDQDFLGTLLAKVDTIRELSKHVDVVVLGGDIFDRPDTPHSVVIKVNRAFSKFPVQVFSIIGNHDIFGYEGTTVDATALGSLFEMGNVKRLDCFNMKQGNDIVHLYGMHAFDKDEWQVPESPGFKVLVSHKMITPVPIPNAHCIMPEDVAKKTNADLILSGDIHQAHNLIVDGKLFINPGSMSRLSIDDRDRQPQVAIVEIEDGEASPTILPIHSKPAEQVFDLRAYSNRMASQAHTDEFVRTYVNAVFSVTAEANKIGDKLIEFMDKNGLGDKMRHTVMEYLARAEREVLVEQKE